MLKYTVKKGQNIYDVALLLHGSIEGVFDLLISNPTLNMADGVTEGMVLEYHEDFEIFPDIVSQMKTSQTVPINGSRNICPKAAKQPLKLYIKISSDCDRVNIQVAGNGEMIIDWGDNSNLESIILSNGPNAIVHTYQESVSDRVVRVYGVFELTELQLRDVEGGLYLTAPVVVNQFTSTSKSLSLDGLPLFVDTYSIDFRDSVISSLSPIVSLELANLDLRGVKFTKSNVVEEYLESIIANHQSRRACEVYLDYEPSTRGMQAINTIINEPSWNSPQKWIFHVGNKTYKAN